MDVPTPAAVAFITTLAAIVGYSLKIVAGTRVQDLRRRLATQRLRVLGADISLGAIDDADSKRLMSLYYLHLPVMSAAIWATLIFSMCNLVGWALAFVQQWNMNGVPKNLFSVALVSAFASGVVEVVIFIFIERTKLRVNDP